MDVVIYARLERWEVDEQLLEQRVAQCRTWCKENQMKVVSIFTDGSCSGAHLDRAGFTEMCEYVIKLHLPIVITGLTQLTTSKRDAALIADVFDELRIRVYSTREGLICTSRFALLGQTAEGDSQNSSIGNRRSETQRSGIPKNKQVLVYRTSKEN